MFQLQNPIKSCVNNMSPRNIKPIFKNEDISGSLKTVQKVQSPISTRSCNSNQVTKSSFCFNSPQAHQINGNMFFTSNKQFSQSRIRTTRIFKDCTQKQEEVDKQKYYSPLKQNINIINYGPIKVYCSQPKAQQKISKTKNQYQTQNLTKLQGYLLSQDGKEDYRQKNEQEEELQSRFHDASQQTCHFLQQSYNTMTLKNAQTGTFNSPDNSVFNITQLSCFNNASSITGGRKCEPFSLKHVSFNEKDVIYEQEDSSKIIQLKNDKNSEIKQNSKNYIIFAWTACLFSAFIILLLVIFS